tara:strand:- start:470 stop:1258 length:789 start_codon:yes stop_codon:yes gene_type:complete
MRDAAGILDATAIPTIGDGVVAPRYGQPYLSQVGFEPRRLKIGIWNEAPRDDLVLHPDCHRLTSDAGKLLEALGHSVEESHPSALDDPAIAGRFSAIWMAGANLTLKNLSKLLQREVTIDDVEIGTWLMAQAGARTSGLEVLQAQADMGLMRRATLEWWEDGWDLLLTPTTLLPPPRLGDLVSTEDEPMRNSFKSIPYAAFTSPFNATGQPAISLPTGFSSDGLPIGIQLVAAYGREDLLIQVGSQLEAEIKWNLNRAPIHA